MACLGLAACPVSSGSFISYRSLPLPFLMCCTPPSKHSGIKHLSTAPSPRHGCPAHQINTTIWFDFLGPRKKRKKKREKKYLAITVVRAKQCKPKARSTSQTDCTEMKGSQYFSNPLWLAKKSTEVNDNSTTWIQRLTRIGHNLGHTAGHFSSDQPCLSTPLLHKAELHQETPFHRSSPTNANIWLCLYWSKSSSQGSQFL